jgi:hypothetical protein
LVVFFWECIYVCMGAWVLVVVVATPLSHTPLRVSLYIHFSVEGPGAAACEPVAPVCPSGDHTGSSSAPPPFPIPASVPLLGHDHEEAETGVGEEMKARFLIIGDLGVSSAGAGGGAKEWGDRLRRAMRGAVPGLDEGQEALQVSVWGAGLDPFFFPDAAAGAEEGRAFKVRVYVYAYVSLL